MGWSHGQTLDAGNVARFEAAKGAAQQNPSVIEAAAKLSNASTPQEKAVAMAEFRFLARKAILEYDPSLSGMLDKIFPAN